MTNGLYIYEKVKLTKKAIPAAIKIWVIHASGLLVTWSFKAILNPIARHRMTQKEKQNNDHTNL